MEDIYTDELLKKEDIENLLPLYESAFGRKFSFKLVQKKFFSSYQVKKSSFVTFFNSKKIVSFYGIICQKATFNNELFYIGQSCDSMTHKDFGGKGLFVNLAKKVYNHSKNNGIDFIYGFPNETIYNLRIKKLGWQHQENINYYKESVKTLPISKLAKKFPIFKKPYLYYLHFILIKAKSKASHFNNSVIENNIGGILHDLDYFNYKKSDDKFILDLENTKLWVKFDGLMWIGDFETTDSNSFSKILKSLKKIAILAGCSSIVFHFHEGSVNDAMLHKIIKPKGTLPYGFINLGDKNLNRKFRFSGSDFDTW